jgi:hypothetical protein
VLPGSAAGAGPATRSCGGQARASRRRGMTRGAWCSPGTGAAQASPGPAGLTPAREVV